MGSACALADAHMSSSDLLRPHPEEAAKRPSRRRVAGTERNTCFETRPTVAPQHEVGVNGAITRQLVGWVERSETHHSSSRTSDGFRKCSTHPTGYFFSIETPEGPMLSWTPFGSLWS
jgi:hypothetical protein